MMGGRMHASVGGEMEKMIIDSVPIVGKAPSHPLPSTMPTTALYGRYYFPRFMGEI